MKVMKLIKLLQTLIFVLPFFTYLKFSNLSATPLDDLIRANKPLPLGQLESELTQEFKRKYLVIANRPSSCPLSSKFHSDILEKVASIRVMFENACFKEADKTLDSITQSAQAIQASADSIASTGNPAPVSTAAPDPDAIVTPTPVPTKGLNPKDIIKLMTGMKDLSNIQKCQIDNRSFLEKATAIVLSITTVGSYVPGQNGSVLLGGGAATAAVLTLLDTMIKRHFDFAKREYREIFIKLNCAFFDVRGEMNLLGVTDIPTHIHREDKDKTEELAKNIKNLMDENIKKYQAILTAIEKEKVAGLKQTSDLDSLLAIKASFTTAKLLTEKSLFAPASNNDVPAASLATQQKLKLLDALAKLYPELNQAIITYRQKNFNTIAALDISLQQLIQSFNYQQNPELFAGLSNMPNESFEQNVRTVINTNLERILITLDQHIQAIGDKWLSETMVDEDKNSTGSVYVPGGKINVATFLAKLKESSEKLAKENGQAAQIIDRTFNKLERITRDREYSSRDDGREVIVNIIEEYNKVVKQIYGMTGYTFLAYTTRHAFYNYFDFQRKFHKFQREHRFPEPGMPIPPANSIERKSACQDAQPFRSVWQYASGLSEQSYDFLETNADLFHSDVWSIHINRPEYHRHYWLLTRWEKIRRHYHSAMFANKRIHGENLNIDSVSQRRMFYPLITGGVMWRIHESRPQVTKLQQLIETYQCGSISNDIDPEGQPLVVDDVENFLNDFEFNHH
jgi:hypothetical protein